MTMTLPTNDFYLDPSTIRRAVLPNGLRVLLREDRSAPVVAIVTYVSAGYFDETDDIVGIAHVLEHMYFKGTPSRGVGEIAKQTKAVGGYLNAATIYDHTSYYTVLPSSGFVHGLEVQADAYANSLIDSEELARELEVIIQEAKRKADNPPAVATETLYELLHDRHRIRRWRIGREPELRALTRDSLLRFYRNFYHPGNTVLTIVGAVDPDAALAQVTRLYGSLPSGEPTRMPGPSEEGVASFRYREWSGDIGQSQLAFGWRTPGTLHPDSPALDLAAAILGTGRASRLYRAVRERKLATSVSAYNYTPTELGVFVVHAETPPATTPDAARGIWDQLRRLRDGEVGDLELERAKRIYESRWVRRLEDMEGQANYLAEWEAMGDWKLGDAYLERMLATTRDDITRVAVRYLDADAAGVLVYRPDGTPEVAADADAMRALLDEPRPQPLPAGAPYVPHAAAATPPTPRFEREEAGVRVYRTERGVPILVRRKPGSPLVHAGVFSLGGASEEREEKAGITSLMVRTAIKGTERRTALQIAEEGEMLGGSIGASNTGDSFGWSISVPARHAAAAVDLLADVTQHPVFPDDALETERAVALADLVASRDDMFRYPMRLASEEAFRGHPYGIPASGTESSLPRVTVADLREWHRERVLTAPTVIALVGDGDPDALAALAAREFAALADAPARELPDAEWSSEVRVRVESREKAQTALAIYLPGPSRRDEDRFTASMIATVASGLGGRFFDELRDKQSLCYTVQAFPSARRLGGSFVSYIATSPEKEEVARAGLLEEIEKFRTIPVSAEELERAQTYSIGVHAIRQQSGGAVLGEVADAWLFGELADLERYEARVRAVSAESIRRVASRYFLVGRRVEGVVRGVGRAV
jgi:zinc protease